MIHDLDDSGQEPWLDEHGIELFRGEGRLDGERRVVVGDTTLVAKRVVVVATGSAAAMPPIEGLDSVEAWNNRDATTSKRIPRSMIVLGGGPVGVELAQAWSALGTKVALVEGGERILAREEPFASEEVADRAAREARRRRPHRRPGRAGRQDRRRHRGRARRRRAARGGGAAGRGRPQAAHGGDRPRLGRGRARRGRLPRDRPRGCGSAAASWLYAVGDVTGRALFTHMGKYQAWVAAENALGREVEAISEELGPPRVTFTDPQVASVGRTLAQAQEAGIDATAVDVAHRRHRGRQLLRQGDRRHDAGSSSTAAGGRSSAPPSPASRPPTSSTRRRSRSSARSRSTRLRHAVAAYPTRSEIWLKLLEAYGLAEVRPSSGS